MVWLLLRKGDLKMKTEKTLEKWVISATGWVEDESESSHGVNGVFDSLDEAWEASKASAFEDLRDTQTAEIEDWEAEERPVPFVSSVKVVEVVGLEEARQYFDGTHGHKVRQVYTHTVIEFDPSHKHSDGYRQWIGRYYINLVDFAGPGPVL